MASFDWNFPYPSRRMPVLARNLVAASQPLAAQAGLRMLQNGGNAVDAALAAAIALTVVEPTMNGIGGDAFAILWDGSALHGLNASGRSPASWNPGRFAGRDSMPQRGWDAVTVPGAVSAWVELSTRFGKLPFEKLFEPAIGYAENGFHVSPITAAGWSRAAVAFADSPDFAPVFLRDGQPPRPGQLFVHRDQAATLRRIAETRGEAFYRGDLAERIAAHARAGGGALTEADLADHRADWGGTVSRDYRGLTLHEIPPNGQGLAALLMLGILEPFPMEEFPPDSAASVHLQLESMKLAFADAGRYISDSAFMTEVSWADLLAPDYLAARSRQIDPGRALFPAYGMPPRGGTVYLAAADAEGMMISFIQSNFNGFGSGVVIPGTGIAMQNRGYGFNLQPGHPNAVGPGKRPYHTIIPGFVTEAGAPLMAFGVMGGSMQPQGHAQMILRIRDHGQNPQAAVDAPRWRIADDQRVLMEPGFPPETLNALTALGHRIEIADFTEFGGAQLVCRIQDGGYLGASDPRKDGQAVGF